MPVVTLGPFGEASIAATVFAIVDRAAARRPEVVEELLGTTVRLELGEDYWPVKVSFDRHAVEVADDDGEEADLVVRGALPDVTALLAAPLTAGVPRSRAALARLADGRVELDGPLALGRRVLRLLTVR